MSNVAGTLAADSIAKIWLYREKVEFEVSFLFAKLHEQLNELEAPPFLLDLVAKAKDDELEHAAMCRRIVVSLNPALQALPLDLRELQMPTADWSSNQKALYTSVALSCITETFSTALLLEMRKHSRNILVKQTIRKILKDEIEHSRIGWAHLAWANSQQQELAWLGDWIPGMVQASLQGKSTLYAKISEEHETFGILMIERSQRLIHKTFCEVIAPGLQLYGIATGPALALLERQNISS
ncbi:MAG: ferritin-like domain-containing protein [Spirochaetota bacterium]